MAKVKCPHCNSSNIAKTMKGGLAKGSLDFSSASKTNTIPLGMGRMTGVGGDNASLAPVEYICYDCDCLFNEVFTVDGEVKETTIKKEPVPDEVIEQVRAELVNPLKKERPYVSAVIFALLTLYCVIYIFVGISNDSMVQVVLATFFGTLFIIPTVLKFKKISKLNREIEEYEMPSTREFKKQHKDLFRAYSQYN